MRMLARHFVVVVTPERYTIKVCHECQGDKCCGRWAAQEEARGGREICGVRFCTKCQRPWGRDHNAALNIASDCVRLWKGEPLVGPQATDEEAKLAAREERLGAPDREGVAGGEDAGDGPRAC
jgi:transposase